MQKNTYSAQIKSTKPTKIILCIIWVLIIAVIASLVWVFYQHSDEIGNKAENVKLQSGFDKTVIANVYDKNHDSSNAVFLLNFNTSRGKISVACLQNDIKADSMTLDKQYEYGGIIQLKKSVEQLFEIGIDYYIDIDCDLLESVSSIMGGVEYEIYEDMFTKDDEDTIICDINKGKQTLSGQQLTEFFRFDGWDAEKRANELVKLCGAMINEYSTKDISEKIARLFGDTATELKTDISVLQANSLKNDYDYFLKHKSTSEIIDVFVNEGKVGESSVQKIQEIF